MVGNPRSRGGRNGKKPRGEVNTYYYNLRARDIFVASEGQAVPRVCNVNKIRKDLSVTVRDNGV